MLNGLPGTGGRIEIVHLNLPTRTVRVTIGASADTQLSSRLLAVTGCDRSLHLERIARANDVDKGRTCHYLSLACAPQAYALEEAHTIGSALLEALVFEPLVESLGVSRRFTRVARPDRPVGEQERAACGGYAVALTALVNPRRQGVLSFEVFGRRLRDSLWRPEPHPLPLQATLDHPPGDAGMFSLQSLSISFWSRSSFGIVTSNGTR